MPLNLRRSAMDSADLLLHFEDVRHLEVKALRPQAIAIAHVDQLRTDSHSVLLLAHAAFDDRGNLEQLADGAHVLHGLP